MPPLWIGHEPHKINCPIIYSVNLWLRADEKEFFRVSVKFICECIHVVFLRSCGMGHVFQASVQRVMSVNLKYVFHLSRGRKIQFLSRFSASI